MGYDRLGIVGTIVGDKYLVEEAVGEGSFSVVYRATHKVWQLPVALKCFKGFEDASPETRERLVADFVQEGAVLSELSGRNATIVQARDTGTLTTSDGDVVPYIVLEWLEGQTLESALEERRARFGSARWPLEAVIRFVEPLATALGMVHRRGIAHRDVKPANVWVSGPVEADDTYVKLLDFGVAKVVKNCPSERFRKTGGLITSFTPAYGAPEQFSRTLGATGPWTDVYALALMVVELLLGQPAIEGDDFIQLGMAAIDPARRPTPRAFGIAVPGAVERVLAKALSVNPDERYADADAFWAALRNAERGLLARIATRGESSADSRRALAPLSMAPSGRSSGRASRGFRPSTFERRILMVGAAAALLFGSLIGSSAYRSWPWMVHVWRAASTEVSQLPARITPAASEQAAGAAPRTARPIGRLRESGPMASVAHLRCRTSSFDFRE